MKYYIAEFTQEQPQQPWEQTDDQKVSWQAKKLKSIKKIKEKSMAEREKLIQNI